LLKTASYIDQLSSKSNQKLKADLYLLNHWADYSLLELGNFLRRFCTLTGSNNNLFKSSSSECWISHQQCRTG